jgi:thioesterase domain-containing protein/acyl carrier protein
MLVPGTEGQPSIGFPITGASIYLLDQHGKAVTDGDVGEIYIGGSGVGRGYRNRPELTESSFIDDPFAGIVGARMYRTGDRGRLREDGSIEFHGRLDRQIKIRGFRIELDEIGSVLSTHPAVAFAVVTTKLSEFGERQLLAHVLPRENIRLASTAELQAYLRLRLPDYMVPPAFMRLHTLPLSASGKIDFELLAGNIEPLMVESISAENSISPTEGKLLGLIRTLLENPKLSRTDNFFLAGGHSLLGMQLVMRLGETFKVNLTLRQLFEAPTVERLTTLIERLLDEQRLATIWKSLLEKPDIGLDDNFFAVGGDAEMIPPLQARISEEFGKQIPASLLVQSQTIREQIKSMQNLTDVYPLLPSGVLALQSKGTRDGIFWVHYFNVNLAKAVSEDQPFLVVKLMHEDLQALGEVPTLESIAASLVSKIVAAQPGGPLTLGGLCLGGILAFEIACQLRQAGREVALLVLVDPPDPSILDSRFPLRPKLSQFGYLLKRALRMGPRMSLLSLRERISSRFAPPPIARLGNTEFEIAQEMIEAAASRYRPGTYDGKVLLLLAAERPPHLDFLPSWRAVVGQDLHAEYIDAHHNDLTNGLNMQRIANAISRHSVELESPVSSS